MSFLSLDRRCDVCSSRLVQDWPSERCGLCANILSRAKAEEREACLEELAMLEVSSGENSHARRLVLREAQAVIRARGEKKP